MSDTSQQFFTVGAAAADAVNDHPTLRFAHLTPERVVNAPAAERLELHRMTLEAGATRLAAELERWAPDEQLETLSSEQLAQLERDAVTSELAARCNAQLRCRRSRLVAERHAVRIILELGPVGARAAAHLFDTFGCGAVRPCGMDTGREHGPIAEHVRLALSDAPRGWLLASEDAGRVSLVLWRRGPGQTWPSRPMRLHTLETRLGW